MSLRTRVIGLCAAAAVLPLVVMLAVTLLLRDSATDKIGGVMKKMAHANVTRIAMDVYTMCETAHRLVMERVTAGSEGAGAMIRDMGPVRVGPQSYELSVPGREGKVTVPFLYFGETAFSAETTRTDHEPYVDLFKQITGLDTTVFVRVNEHGDMMRVATNVFNAEGGRKDIGTLMTPEERPDIISAILAAKTFEGPVFALGSIYAARYRPLQDKSGRVVGMVGVGEIIRQVTAIQKSIEDIRVGEDGYVWVIGTRGVQKNKYIISKDASRNGMDITDDIAGTDLLAKIKQAVESRPGEITYATYLWKNPGDTTPRKKVAAMTYFPGWDWVIGVALYEDNYLEAQHHVGSILNRLIAALFIAGFVILLLVLAGSALVVSRITRSISLAAGVSRKISRGEIKNAEKQLADAGVESPEEGREPPREETRLLLASLASMTHGLNGLIGKVQQAGIKVQGCATQIAASASQLNATVTEQAASTAQVSATSRAISLRVQGLSKTMTEVNDVARRTADLADRGQSGLNLLSGSMEELKNATLAVSRKLSAISSKASSIGDIVKTITKVADQTNLLALNAAIEAEKAGDYGLGFSVVAREIKRLSDQTAAAVLDIENVVHDMGEAVSEGNAEMSRFVARVDVEVSNVNDIGEGARDLINGVQELFPRFSEVSSAMAEQTNSASEISQAMEQLALAVNQTKESLTEFASAAHGLSQAVASLQEQSGHFSLR